MNKVTIIFLGLLIAIVLVIGYWFFFTKTDSDTNKPTPQDQGGVENPLFPSLPPVKLGTGTSSPQTVTVASQSGDPLMVKDFINNGETTPDVVNPGYYVLAGSIGYCLGDGRCPSGASTTDFKITYNSASQFFNIVIFTEPIGKVRSIAEYFLLDRLGLTQQELCTLRYSVGVPYRVSPINAGKNIGFSFCPGSIQFDSTL